MTERHGLTDDEWELLLYVPFAVFYAVAYADGKLSYPESNRFADLAKQIGTTANRPQDGLVRDVMHEVSINFGAIAARMNAMVGQGLSFAEILNGGRQILDMKVDSLEATVFKNTMIGIAGQVADVWPLFGRSTTAEEHAAIETIKTSLGVGGSGGAYIPFST